MTYQLHGKHLIAGRWEDGPSTFLSEPATGEPRAYSVGTPGLVAQAVEAAEAAVEQYAATTREQRAAFLEAIADEIALRGRALTAIAHEETGLPPVRLDGERSRTMGQLRMFAQHIRKGDYLDRRHDQALPDRQPLPRPDLRMLQQPVGPVAVFGASNFPLAFSVAGGDTAAALAAGCPVVVKGHSAHPGTGEVVADAILSALKRQGMPAGVFSLIQGGDKSVGAALVSHPLIQAVGFTGSLAGGRALFDLCAARPQPIPFYGELGSVNPMLILPAALQARAAGLGEGWAASLVMGAGQFCTNPGLVFLVETPSAGEFVKAAAQALEQVPSQCMLTDGIAKAYRDGQDRIVAVNGVRPIFTSRSDGRQVMPCLYEVSGGAFLEAPVLWEEVFGPLGVIVRVADVDELLVVVRRLHGQLTATVQMDEGDTALARRLLPLLSRKAGRVLVNGFPTGVEVCDAMVHGGPYPASTNFGATSVGTLSIRRFLRPVCYQNVPFDLLPADLMGSIHPTS